MKPEQTTKSKHSEYVNSLPATVYIIKKRYT